MKFDIITLFPEMFNGPLSESIIKRANEKGLIEINCHNLRDCANDKHKTVDDTPCGGGKGMVLKVDVMDKALAQVKSSSSFKVERNKVRTILLTPQGKRFNQDKAIELAKNYDKLILICGHYEGFDERIHEHLADLEISVGDYVLSGGELPALIMVDSMIRLIPGVLGNDQSLIDESFEDGLEYPQYTRPSQFNGWDVPEVLLSGHHANIKKWRKEKSVELTKKRRPDIAL